MQRTQPVVLVGVDEVEREVHIDVSDGRRCDSMLSLYQDSARVRCAAFVLSAAMVITK
jgi:hypothetical protein